MRPEQETSHLRRRPFNPGDLQQDLVFVGAVSADSKNADAAKAFLDYLKTPDAVSVFKAKGVTPG